MIEIDINPIAFTIGSVVVRWYGIMVALAIVVLILWMLREVKRKNYPYETVINGALIAIPSGVIVSKLLHVIDQWGYYSQNPGQIFNGAGLTIYGAVIGGALGIWIYTKISKLPFGAPADSLAPGIILAQTIGRVGCIINGCCYGEPTTLPCGVVYTHPESYAPLGIAVHPTQVYEIIYNLIVFAVLLKLRGRLKPDGSLFLIYLSLYSAWRIGIGFLREGTPIIFGLHQAQIIGIIILAIAIPMLALRTRWVQANEENERE
ncbi:prolipoprotein diacylglyceryl transferase [Chloroflexota bacterium]